MDAWVKHELAGVVLPDHRLTIRLGPLLSDFAHCFACDQNLNSIDLLRVLGYDFVSAVTLLDRRLTKYETRQPRRTPPV